jgi:hypothetical protein
VSEQSGSWQPDPFGRHEYRFWDGSEWTDQVANEGVTSVDPPVASADAGPGTNPSDSAPAASEPASPAEPAPPAEAAAPADPAPTMAEPPVSPAAGPPPADPQGWAAPDATTAMAAAPPPAAAPGAPGGPGVPPEPTPTGGGGGGSSNLPGIIVGVVLLALVLGAAAWFLFLRDDDSDARATVVSGLRDEFGLSSAQANCIADELDDRIDLDQLARDIEADNDPSGAQMIAIFEAFENCDVDLLALDGGDTTDTTTATTDSDDGSASGPGTSIPSAMLDLIAQGIMEESGLSQAQARCFAEQIFTLDGIDFGSIMSDPDSFGDDVMNDPDMIFSFFEIFERCDIDPLEFDGGFDGGGSGFQQGMSYGDNPTLDRLWDACDAGDGAACDELYFTSEIGSDYEEFGDTCGGRFPGGTVLCANENLN